MTLKLPLHNFYGSVLDFMLQDLLIVESVI